MCHTLCHFLPQVPASLANPPLPPVPPPPCLPWAPHPDLLLPHSTASPPGSPEPGALEEGGSPKDRLRSQSPVPATPPCLTRPPRTDPTTTSASPPWEEARPAQAAKLRPAWVSRRRVTGAGSSGANILMRVTWFTCSSIQQFSTNDHNLFIIHQKKI